MRFSIFEMLLIAGDVLFLVMCLCSVICTWFLSCSSVSSSHRLRSVFPLLSFVLGNFSIMMLRWKIVRWLPVSSRCSYKALMIWSMLSRSVECI